MTSNAWKYSFISKFAALFARSFYHSTFYFWLAAPGLLSRQDVKASSFAGKAAAMAVQALERAGGAIRRGLPGSLFMLLAKHPLLGGSTLPQILSRTRGSILLFLAFSYIIVDYGLRKNSSMAFLAGNWDELLLVFALFVWLLQTVVRGKIIYRSTSMDLPILLYLAVAIFLFLVRSPQLNVAIEGVRVYIEYIFWFFVVSNLLVNKRQAQILINWLVALGTIVALHGVYQYIIGVQIPSSWVDSTESIRTRVFSIVGSPNVLGSFLVMMIPITVSQVLTAQGRLQKYFYVICLVPMVLSLMFTYSRGAWLAMIGAFFIYGLIYNWRILLPLSAVGLAALKLIPGISSRLDYMFSLAYMLSSARAGRIARWNMAIAKLTNHPFTGEGFGRFGGAVAARHIPSSVYVDNFYLKTAAESGIIGLAALLWLYVSGIRCALHSYKVLSDPYLKGLAGGLIASLLGVLLHNTVENIFEVPMMSTYFWLLLGLTAALPHIEAEENLPISTEQA